MRYPQHFYYEVFEGYYYDYVLLELATVLFFTSFVTMLNHAQGRNVMWQQVSIVGQQLNSHPYISYWLFYYIRV